jgi:hypothetical protein
VAGGPTFTASSNTVALTDQFMAVRRSLQVMLAVFSRINLIMVHGTFCKSSKGEQTGGLFGFDVSIAESTRCLVGAPGIFVNQTVPAGATYYYEYDRTSLEWQQLGFRYESEGTLFPRMKTLDIR